MISHYTELTWILGGVLIGHKFYLPFMAAEPNCFELDISTWTWKRHPIKIKGNIEIKAFITTAVAIGPLIYLFGGREVQSFTLANKLYVLDSRDFTLRLIDDAAGSPPRPRHEHSVDVLYDRYVAIFGGLCYHSVGENDLFLYDTVENTWLEPHVIGRTPHIRFGHASAVINNFIYIYGGCQIENDCNRIYDDLYKFDFTKSTWYKFEHPEMFDVRRHATKNRHNSEDMEVDSGSPYSIESDFLIPTTGHYPRDRFQCAMISIGNKLVIFGGHTLRQDDEDNNELFDYSIDQTDIFDPEWCHWTSLDATSEAGSIFPADMSYSVIPTDSAHIQDGFEVFVVGQHKIFEGQSSQFEGFSSASTTSMSGSGDRNKSQSDSYFSVPVDSHKKLHPSGTMATPQAMLNVDGQAEQFPILANSPGRLVKSPAGMNENQSSNCPREAEVPDDDNHDVHENGNWVNQRHEPPEEPPIDMSKTNRNDNINPSRKDKPAEGKTNQETAEPDDSSISNEVKEIFRHEVDLAERHKEPGARTDDNKATQASTTLHSAPMKPRETSASANPTMRLNEADMMISKEGSSDSQKASTDSAGSNMAGSFRGPKSSESTTSEGWYGKDTRKYTLESFCMLLKLNIRVPNNN
ncbi:hypothetical protein INT43_008541 [Umbelopsis isabellina]|uniref:Uncharacterized protein n=1 Tax=Mortierella isabellina TaxID=91625 RepID=A0A8H7PUU4_MORIS|nr:hypothetical protein INT43_008541 [Umbelopsis isabellina]